MPSDKVHPPFSFTASLHRFRVIPQLLFTSPSCPLTSSSSFIRQAVDSTFIRDLPILASLNGPHLPLFQPVSSLRLGDKKPQARTWTFHSTDSCEIVTSTHPREKGRTGREARRRGKHGGEESTEGREARREGTE